MTAVRSACPLNCPDSCAWLVERTEKGLKVKGDNNSVTRGFICSKGKALAERVFSPDRLRFPLLKQGEGFRRISWEEAYNIITEKIKQTCAETGPQGILHHYDFGHNGVLRTLDRRFFQALGGVTGPRGDMCWGAGYRAQEIDFGAVRSNRWDDLPEAKTIILWGRDPATTGVHMMPFLLEAKKAGAKIIVINPVKIKTAELADEFIRVNPGSDGALALGLGREILANRWLDMEFVQNYVQGLGEYAEKVHQFDQERVAAETGLSPEAIVQLAETIAKGGPVSFVCGYGLQRYIGGGNTVRAIDALAAVTGNIGKAGAGVYYAYQYHGSKKNTLCLPDGCYQSRTYPHPTLGSDLLTADPEIRLAFVTRSNPLVQQADSALWRELWRRIPFKVVLDTYLSETARQSDLVLPVTTIFEEEDLFFTSWNTMIHYAGQVLSPQGEARPEPEIFTELAGRLGLGEFFPYQVREWLEYVLEPLAEWGITLEGLQKGSIQPGYIPKVAWEEKQFLTPSGKIELHSHRGKEEFGTGTADYIPAGRRQNREEYPWFLITPHPAGSMHSQFQEEGHTAYIHPLLAEKCYLFPGDFAVAETEKGQLKVRISVSEDIHPQAVVIPEGATAEGKGVNDLIAGFSSDYGENTAYYDMRCSLRKWMID